MKIRFLLIPIFLLIFLLAACGGGDASAEESVGVAATSSESSGSANSGVASAASSSAASTQSSATDGLNEDYVDALPVSTQLIVGSLMLDSTEEVITESQAAKLLPLLQAYQGLSNADSTAQAELDAVVKQLQRNMDPAPIQAIAALQLTSEKAQEMMQEQGIGLRGFGGRARGTEGGGNPGGGGGGFPGGGPGGGGPGGGGLPGQGPGGQVDPEARATAIAERFGSNGGGFLERGMLAALIRNLQVKTGEIDAEQAQRGGFNNRLMQPIADASDVSLETLEAGQAEGQSITEIIEANGGDVEAAREALRTLFSERGWEGDELEQRVTDLFTRVAESR